MSFVRMSDEAMVTENSDDQHGDEGQAGGKVIAVSEVINCRNHTQDYFYPTGLWRSYMRPRVLILMLHLLIILDMVLGV